MSYRRERRIQRGLTVPPRKKMTMAQKRSIAFAGIGIIVLMILLSGCAGPSWSRPGGTQAQLAQDNAQCQYQADLATAAIDNPVHAGIQDALLNISCMKAMGWQK